MHARRISKDIRTRPALRLCVRLFGENSVILEKEEVTVPIHRLDAWVEKLAAGHAVRMNEANGLMMVEIEFLDDPSEERFLRFGTDPSQLTAPIPLKEFLPRAKPSA